MWLVQCYTRTHSQTRNRKGSPAGFRPVFSQLKWWSPGPPYGSNLSYYNADSWPLPRTEYNSDKCFKVFAILVSSLGGSQHVKVWELVRRCSFSTLSIPSLFGSMGTYIEKFRYQWWFFCSSRKGNWKKNKLVDFHNIFLNASHYFQRAV